MRSRLVPPLLVLAIAVIAYLTSLPGNFVYDDEQVIVRNERITNPARAAEVWTTPYWGGKLTGGLYRPLTLFSFVLNHRVNRLEPLGWHLVNVALHALVCLLFYYFCAGFVPAGGALAAALLFAAHPIHTEAVANLVGRAEILAALGFFGAWLLHRRIPVLAALVFAAALFSKEIAVGLPAALLLRDVLERRRPDRFAYALYAVVLAGYFAARYSVLGAFTNPKEMIIYRVDNVIATLPFLSGLWTAFSVFGRYLGLLVFPWRLSADYSYPQITAAGFADPWAWLGLLGVLGLGAAFVFAFRAARRVSGPSPAGAVAMGLALFAIAFFPVSNFVIRIGTVMAERLLYLPSAGFLLAIAGAGGVLVDRFGAPARRAAVPVTVILVVAGTAACLARNPAWNDSLGLMQATVEASPRSARANYNLGVSLYENQRTNEAIASLTTAVTLDPTYTEAWVNLGGYKLGLGKVEEARADLEKAIGMDSTWWTAYVSLGGLEITAGRPAVALGWLEKAVRLDATSDQAWFNLALARLGVADTLGAVDAFRKSVALNPDDPDALNSLAWYLLLTGGDLDEALRNAERATALKPDAATFDTLAEVHLRLGHRAEARAAWQKALAFPGDSDRVRERLRSLDQ